MIIFDTELDKYTVDSQTKISDALAKLNQNKLQILFVWDDQRRLRGVFTDGDFRRWVLTQEHIDIQLSVSEAMNRHYQYLSEDAENSVVDEHLTERVRFIPIVDNNAKIVSIASRKPTTLSIDGLTIGAQSPCYIISEIGNNHNGSLVEAKKLVDESIQAGASAVKFQMRDLSSLYLNDGDSHDIKEDLGSQYVLDLLSRFQLSDDAFVELFTYCRKKGITPLCTPFDKVSADKLVALNVAGFKVASADLTNHEFLRYLCKKRLPLIVSTGMASEQEIQDATALLKAEGASFVLLHCNSTYPAPFKDINLNYLPRLYDYSQGVVGYSGHERGYAVPIAAVAMGAKVIEKHFTLDRELEGNDHKVSLLPSEFKAMVQSIRQVESAMGKNLPRKLSQGEMMNRENLGKSIVSSTHIKKGQTIRRDMLEIKSPGKGLAPYHLDQIVGSTANRDIHPKEFFYESDLSGSQKVSGRHFYLPQEFGIPVRYHDLQLLDESNLSVVEYHLSYKDLLLEPEDYVTLDLDRKLVVHAPELFEKDHVLDLACEDCNYQRTSIEHMNRVFDLARKLGSFYPQTGDVPVVVNVGGFSQNDFLDAQQRNRKYQIFAESLKSLDLAGIDMMVQSMPPFPWHFGGQRYHNLFVSPDEIQQVCEANSLSVCLDVSHSWLACNQFGYDIEVFFSKLGNRIKHLHIADAAGVDDEGLQIGQGDMDMAQIFELMETYCPNATWIPEIWQGHKNQGEGFWIAFDKLEKRLQKLSQSA